MKTNISKSKTVASSLFIISATTAILLFSQKSAPEATSARGFAPIASRTTAQVREAYGQIPLSFEANRGQANEAVNFRARGAGYTLSLSPTEALFALARGNDDEPSPTLVGMKLVGANPGAAVEGVNELEGKVNYLLGNDPARWRTNIPTFGRVRYSGVYPGIDLIYYGNQRRLEYDFAVAPGRDASSIALEFSGAESLEIDPGTGDLLVAVGPERIRQKKPVSYQEIGGRRHEVESRYALRGDGRVGFEVGAYDPGATLIIDPVLVYSTFLGGNTGSGAFGIAVDSSGNAYVVGSTSSTDFPTVNAFQSTSKGGEEVFVTKLNAAGSALVYSTYVGGSDGEFATDIAIDSAGNAYVVGNTSSTDFPTVNAFQSTYGGDGVFGGNGFGDAFVFKLNPAGSALIYSTYLGGSEIDSGKGIAVNSAGNAYVTGYAASTNFPTANAFQGTLAGGDVYGDAFVTKFTPAGSALVYSTYLGGNDNDSGRAIAVDPAGNVYIIGGANSGNFPTTAGAFQTTHGGLGDAFVAKLNAAGSALVYSTFLGGSDREGNEIYGVAIDSAGNAYVTGSTSSTNFPTANAFQGTLAGKRDIFVAKLNGTGSGLVYSTYLGGSDFEYTAGIAVDPAGNAYVTGYTSSASFPTVNAFQNTFGGGFVAAVVAKFNATGAPTYSSYLGGNFVDYGGGIAVDAAGDVYVAGQTFSRCFPTTTGAFDTSFGNVSTVFITKISETAPAGTLNDCPSQLLNIATRMRVLTGDSALIGGFIITGNEAKRVIIRGIGPSLTGIQGVLANPTLELFDSNQVLLGSNDDWTTNRAEVEGTTIPPSNDLESAIVTTLAPGNYTAVLRGQNNGIGVGVVEVYDLNSTANSTLANISSRGFVDTGDNAMIGGFIVGGGSSGTRVLVRGIGPSLASFFPNALENPTLELRNADGSLIRENDDWRDSQETEIQGTTIPPSNSLESAILAAVGNGNYTAILRGKDNTTGVAVVEVYNLQ